MREITFSGSFTKTLTISDVHPRTNRQRATTKDPKTMKGLRRPHFDRDRSAMTPMRGWMISPDSGPAIHTRDVLDFVRPSCRRYGVQSVPELNVISKHFFYGRSRMADLTSHLSAPGKSTTSKSALRIIDALSTLGHFKPGNTHCKPTKLNVNSAIRVDSDFPLMAGVPTHRAVCGILAIPPSAYTQPSSIPPLERRLSKNSFEDQAVRRFGSSQVCTAEGSGSWRGADSLAIQAGYQTQQHLSKCELSLL